MAGHLSKRHLSLKLELAADLHAQKRAVLLNWNKYMYQEHDDPHSTYTYIHTYINRCSGFHINTLSRLARNISAVSQKAFRACMRNDLYTFRHMRPDFGHFSFESVFQKISVVNPGLPLRCDCNLATLDMNMGIHICTWACQKVVIVT